MITKKIIKKLILKIKYKNCKLLSDNISYDVKLHNCAMIYKNVYIDKNCEVGNYTYISENTKIYSNTKIGNYCSIGPNVIIAPGEHPMNNFTTHPITYDKFWNDNLKNTLSINKNTIIENDVWIGCNSMIKSGVIIGTGAVIGACSVVTHDVPPYAVVAGNPAKIIKYRFDTNIIDKLINSKWYLKSKNDVISKIDSYNDMIKKG